MAFELNAKYDPLERLEAWDETTRRVVLARLDAEVGDGKPFVFLSQEDGSLLREIVAVLLGPIGEIDIAGAIDRSLLKEKAKVRYGADPWPRELYVAGLSEVRKLVTQAEGRARLEELIGEVLDGDREGGLYRFVRRVLRDAAEIFYSHPAAWAEIGFPGPAFPEGYRHLACDKKLSWEPQYENG